MRRRLIRWKLLLSLKIPNPFHRRSLDQSKKFLSHRNWKIGRRRLLLIYPLITVIEKQSSKHEKEDLQDVKKRIEREQPHMGTPLAPINITEALPEPAKEALGRRQTLTAPKIKELEPIKRSLKAPVLEALEDHEALAPEDGIALETRKEATEIPFEETKPESEIKKAQSEEPESNETLPKESTGAVAENLRQPPVESPDQSVEKEQRSARETQESAPGATENLTEAVAPKEHIPSPLDEQAVASRELRIYLTETTPILEELSLLMTRAPSLNLDDYDPSEANTHVAVQDLNLKLESLKRDLRILDSKVFSIIPPSKYAQFHELIRQSISHTYLACESVSNYFQDAKPEDLLKVRDHLSKAKEFIELTRKRDNSGLSRRNLSPHRYSPAGCYQQIRSRTLLFR